MMRNVCFVFADKVFYQLSAGISEIDWVFLDEFSLTDEIKEACKRLVLALRIMGNDDTDIFSWLVYNNEHKNWRCTHLFHVSVNFRFNGIITCFRIPFGDSFLRETLIAPMFTVDEWREFIISNIKNDYLDKIKSKNDLKKSVEDVLKDENRTFLLKYIPSLDEVNKMISDLEENKKAFFSACGIE